jgi:ABC-type microcin C transport system permease subunit YejB
MKVYIINYCYDWYSYWQSWIYWVYSSMSQAQEQLVKSFYESFDWEKVDLSMYSKKMKKYESYDWSDSYFKMKMKMNHLVMTKNYISYKDQFVEIKSFIVQ